MYPVLEESRLTEPPPLQPDRSNQLILSPEKLLYGEKLTNQRISITNNWNLVIKLNSAEGKFCSERWWENCKNVLGPDESATLLLSKDDMKQLQKMLENLSVEYKLKNTKENASQWQKLAFEDHQLTVSLAEKKGKIKFRCSFNGELFHWDHSFPK